MSVLFRRPFNNAFDRLIRLEIQMFLRSWPIFQVCGCIGLTLATLLAMSLVIYRGLSPWVMTGIVLVAVSILFGLTMITKIITGEERIINYHHQIVVLIMTASTLSLLGQPVLAYLDATMLGVGLFIACGRIGCLLTGCCHGRPHHWGVCYRAEHAEVGFPDYFVGVRLFPIQLIESLWVSSIVLVGSALIMTGHPPGVALVWYINTYSIGRFCFEFMRGDPARLYRWGFSEAQWTSLLLMCIVVWAEYASILAFHAWHVGATIGLALIMIGISVYRRLQETSKYQLLHPRHVKELAEAVNLVLNPVSEVIAKPGPSSASKNIPIGLTSLGVQVSAGTVKSDDGWIYHYTLSSQNGTMTQAVARILAGLIRQLKHPTHSLQLVEEYQGVFHLLIFPY